MSALIKRKKKVGNMDNEVIASFYRQYRSEIYLYLYSLCKSRELTEDLLQETFLKAILSLQNNHANVRAWLYMVARNLYFNYIKKEKNNVVLEELEEYDVNKKEDLLNEILKEEQKYLLYKALGKIETQKREVLELQYFAGFSQKEIAMMLHTSPENVRVLSYRGKKEIKKYLEAKNYEI